MATSCLVLISLAVNVAVLVPVCGSLVLQAGWTHEAYGPRTPARGILTSIYVAILLVSCALLLHRDDHAAAALLAVQVAYKVTTPFTVGRLRNPVVLSNLAIAALHLVTLATLHAAAPS